MSAIVLHDDCEPGGAMCFSCEQLWVSTKSKNGVRLELVLLRSQYPANIQKGFCLNCGDSAHLSDCSGKDFWGNRCGCSKFIRRGGASA
jgi:hypothetical protein